MNIPTGNLTLDRVLEGRFLLKENGFVREGFKDNKRSEQREYRVSRRGLRTTF